MPTEDPIKDKTTFDKGRLSGREGTVWHKGKTRGQTFGGELGKVIDKSNRPKLGDELRALDLRNERHNRIIEPRDVHRPQTKSLDNRTD